MGLKTRTAITGLLVFLSSCTLGSLPTVRVNNEALITTSENTSSCSKGDCSPQSPIDSNFIHIEIDPSGAGHLPQQILNLSVYKDLPAQIELKPRFFYYGTIETHSFNTNTSAHESPLISDIIAMASDIIAIPKVESKLPENIIALLKDEQNNSSSMIDSQTGHFTLSLIGGKKYQIVVNPEGKNNLPPTFIPIQINADHNETIMPKNQGSIVMGQLVLSPPVLREFAQKAFVKIFQDNKLVSSVGILSNDGNFLVQLAFPLPYTLDKNHKLYLVIEPNVEYDYLPVIRERIFLVEDEMKGKTIRLNPITIEQILKTHTKTIAVVNEKGEPIQDARIYLKRNLDKNVIEKYLQTNDKGIAQTKLLNGAYKLAVVAPQDSQYGMYQLEKWKVEDDEPSTIVLPIRQELKATVLDYHENPVAGALIQLTRISGDASLTQENLLKKASLRIEARSNQEGRWCMQNTENGCAPLKLDPGKYRIFIIPPPGEKLPYQTSTFDFPENNTFSVILHKPIQISGRVIMPGTNAPLGKAFIKIFSAFAQLESKEPLLLGQGITDEEGNFSAFIYLGK